LKYNDELNCDDDLADEYVYCTLMI